MGLSRRFAIRSAVRQHGLYEVEGERWEFGRANISDVRVASLRHQSRWVGPVGDWARFSVAFVLEGRIDVTIDGSMFVFIANTAAVLPAGRLPTFVCDGTARVLLVSVPRPVITKDADLIPGRPAGLSASVVRTDPALPFLMALTHTAQLQNISIEPAESIISKLCTGLLAADQEWRSRPERPEVAAILSVISQHFADAGFDVRAIARAQNVSQRHVQQVLFEQADGKRAEHFIAERRLISAMTLMHPETGTTIDRIATLSGYRSAADLEHAVEEAYGVSASVLLTGQQNVTLV